jgi:hypothetical protein
MISLSGSQSARVRGVSQSGPSGVEAPTRDGMGGAALGPPPPRRRYMQMGATATSAVELEGSSEPDPAQQVFVGGRRATVGAWL